MFAKKVILLGLDTSEIYSANAQNTFPATGNIDIGTHNPQAKLAVKVGSFSMKVKVAQTGWADYVFEPSYRLPSLTEVEAFVKQYKHLPDVPSAKELEDAGIDLGEDQAILLRKVEGLTLYIIEQNKRIELLEGQLKIKSRS